MCEGPANRVIVSNNATQTAQDQNAEEHRATRLLLEKASRKLEGKFTDDPPTEAELRMKLALGFSATRDFHQMKTQVQAHPFSLSGAPHSIFGPSHAR